MAEVTLSINGRNYSVACDDGEETHLERLAGLINQRIDDLKTVIGQVDEPRLLVMTSLLIADELSEASSKLKVPAADSQGVALAKAMEQEAAATLDRCAGRLEAIAASLEDT